MVYYFPLRGDEMEIEVSKDWKKKKKSARGYFSRNSNRRHSFDECKERSVLKNIYTRILHRFAFWNDFYPPFFFFSFIQLNFISV